MTVLKPVLSKILGNVLSSVLGDSIVQRYFTSLDSTFQQYYEFSTPVVLTGDFEIEFEYSGNAAEFTPIINSLAGDRVARIAPGGVLQMYAGSFSLQTTTDFTDGKLNKAKFTRAGTTLTLAANGTQESIITDGATAGDVVIRLLGNRSGVYLDGILTNLSITGDGIDPIFLKLGENFGTTMIGVNSAQGTISPYGNVTAIDITESDLFTEQSNGDWLGVNIWGAGDSVSTGSEGTFAVVLSAGSVITPGVLYRTSWDATGFTAGNMQFRYGSSSGITVSVDGSYTEDITATSGTLRTRIGNLQANTGASFINQTVKQLLEVAP